VTGKSFSVLLKKGGRTMQCHTVESREKADVLTQSWYAQGDGRSFEVIEQGGPVEQIAPRIEPDQYLTQAQSDFRQVSIP
jgi:hypothetical protein